MYQCSVMYDKAVESIDPIIRISVDLKHEDSMTKVGEQPSTNLMSLSIDSSRFL